MQETKRNKIRTKIIIIEEKDEEDITVMQLAIDKKQLLDFINSFILSVSILDKVTAELPVIRKYDDHVFIRKGSGYKKVAIREIAYLEAARNYCDVHLEDNTCLNVSMPMNEVYDYLNPACFKRIHRSFIVHLEYVDTYRGNMVILRNGKEIVVGREYRDKISEEFICIGSRKRVKDKNDK